MLLEIKVSQFAIIDSLHLHFRPGLNILSGETGAGKSILLKSLSLLMGAKASTDIVPKDADQAVVEGCFDISERHDIHARLFEMGIEAQEDLLIVRRLISPQGQSRVYLNGTLQTLGSLREVVSPLVEVAGQSVPLIEMTGQHDQRHLLSKSYHLDVLDRYCNDLVLKSEFTSQFERRLEVEQKIQMIQKQEQERAQRLDFLIYQRDEISALNLAPGEELELESKVKRLKSLRKLVDFGQSVESAISTDEDSVLARLNKVVMRTNDVAKYDESLQKLLEPLTTAKIQIEEVMYEMNRYMGDLEAEPEKLDELEARLSDLRHVQKKFGPTLQDVMERFEEMNSEIKSLEGAEDTLQELLLERDALKISMRKIGAELTEKRKQGAKKLGSAVNHELKDLNMKGVLFDIHITSIKEPVSTGFDDVEFYIQVGKTEDPRPLAKAASGGELSRILLSLKHVIGHSNLPRTYLFDEVDTGVSGETAQKVGRKLKTIAKGQQVICVTHLPQVAVFGDAQYLIEKDTLKNKVRMSVQEVTRDERVKEIARLISGEEISKTSLQHAKELLKQAKI